jgi:chromosome segregation ATPase
MEVSDVPPPLRERLGTDATVSLLELFDTARQEWGREVTTAAIERFERRLGEEVGAVRADMTELRTEVGELRTEVGELRTEVGELRTEVGELRTDMGELRTEMGEFRTEMRAEMSVFRSEVREDLATVRLDFANLRLEDAAARFELLKWSFVFWLGQVFAVAGVMVLVLRLSRG